MGGKTTGDTMKTLLLLLAILSFGLPAPIALAQPIRATDVVANSGYWYYDQVRRVWIWVSC